MARKERLCVNSTYIPSLETVCTSIRQARKTQPSVSIACVDGGSLITDKHAYELLSRAYVSAVASKAQAHLGDIVGHAVSIGGDEFDYGIDGIFHSYGETDGEPFPKGCGFNFQLKATTRWTIDGEDIVYDIKGKAYNKLVRQNNGSGLKGVLLLLCIHKDLSSAIEISHDHCILKRSVYWTVLRGADTPQGSIRIRIPIKNLFDESALATILDQAERGVL